MLVIDSLHKRYGSRPVLDGLSLSVRPGQVLGLIGSNGAGKTTAISIACGLITHDGGSVRVGHGDAANVDVASHPRAAAGLIGLAPQDLGIYPMLTVRENLLTLGELAGLGRREARERAAQVAAALDLGPQLGQRADTLSGGQARRLHTGMALLHRPAVLFLDEPTVGADVAARRAILEVVRDLAAQGSSVVYTTHYLSELTDLGADVAILHGGRIVLEGTAAEVIAAHASPSVAIVTSGATPELPGWRPTSVQGASTTRWQAPTIAPGTSHTALLADAIGRLGPHTSLEAVDVEPASLETAFLAVTGSRLSTEVETTDVAYA